MVQTRRQASKANLSTTRNTRQRVVPEIKEEACKMESTGRQLRLRQSNRITVGNEIDKKSTQSSLRTQSRTQVNNGSNIPSLPSSSSLPSSPPAPQRVGSHIPYTTRYTSEQVNNLINYIVNDKMSIADASDKVQMVKASAVKFYNKYKREGKIPDPYLNTTGNRKLFEKHTQFITNLYKQNRNLKNEEVLAAINSHFPDLNISLPALLGHIHNRMKDVYKTTGTANRERNRKLFDPHTRFVADILKNEPGVSLKIICVRLQEAFPGLTIDPTTLSRHVHIHLEHLYKDTVSAQTNHKRKMFEQHFEFVEELYKYNPEITKKQVYDEFTQAFPEIQIKERDFHKRLTKGLGEWYITKTRTRPAIPQKLFPEHVLFLRNLYIKNPAMTVDDGRKKLSKCFIGCNVSKTSLCRFLTTKCGLDLAGRYNSVRCKPNARTRRKSQRKK